MSNFCGLPDEILDIIVRKLDYADAHNLSIVSKNYDKCMKMYVSDFSIKVNGLRIPASINGQTYDMGFMEAKNYKMTFYFKLVEYHSSESTTSQTQIVQISTVNGMDLSITTDCEALEIDTKTKNSSLVRAKTILIHISAPYKHIHVKKNDDKMIAVHTYEIIKHHPDFIPKLSTSLLKKGY